MSTVNLLTKSLQSAVISILKPLFKILIRNGVPCSMFIDMAKWAYYEVAWDDYKIPYKKQTANRVSMLTGLTRKEILKYRKQPYLTQGPNSGHRGVRIISAWVREPTYQDQQGEPALLPLEGGDKSFAGLVKKYGGDITAQTVLDELLRIKTIAVTPDDHVKLLSRAYIPKTDNHEKIQILGEDSTEFIETIDHNIVFGAEHARLQRKVFYDNIPVDQLPRLKALLTEMAQESLEKMDTQMAKHDRDRTNTIEGHGRAHAGIGIYYFEKIIQESDQLKKDNE